MDEKKISDAFTLAMKAIEARLASSLQAAIDTVLAEASRALTVCWQLVRDELKEDSEKPSETV